MTRIWLNHWFSTAYNIINLLRENNPDFWLLVAMKISNLPLRVFAMNGIREPF